MPANPERTIPGPAALFAGFLTIGLCGFGGVLPWARRVIVEQRGWLAPAEFTDLLALCQFLPGPNVVNMSIALGARFAGWRGSVAAVTGILAAPMAIVIGLGVLYGRYGALPWVANGFGGLAAAASGLVLATAVKIALPLRGRPAGILVAGAAFVVVALLRVPLLLGVCLLVPVSVWLHRRVA
jgi:chromate transporter